MKRLVGAQTFNSFAIEAKARGETRGNTVNEKQSFDARSVRRTSFLQFFADARNETSTIILEAGSRRSKDLLLPRARFCMIESIGDSRIG